MYWLFFEADSPARGDPPRVVMVDVLDGLGSADVIVYIDEYGSVTVVKDNREE